MTIKLTIPISDEAIRGLQVGDSVLLSGVMITGRDAVHKWLADTFIKKTRQPAGDDLEVYQAIRPILDGGLIYHCGPVVGGLDTKQYRFVAAGPTTSIREEPYQGDVMHHFNLKGVIGKGGMARQNPAGLPGSAGGLFPRHRRRGLADRRIGAARCWACTSWILACPKPSG